MTFESLKTATLTLGLLLAVPSWAQNDSASGETASSQSEKEKWDVNKPGGEWRTVTIDTTETTWSSVDVSPDGKTVIFDMLGDIYTVPLAGGEATALTSGIAWNVQPRYSPDGKSIAFISDRNGGDNIWVMHADGGDPQEVTSERDHMIHNPTWSPDSQWIVARKGYVSTRSIPSAELWLYHRSGGAGVQVVERPHGPSSQKNIAEPAFSPDGRYIYYSQDTTPGRVWQYNKDGTGQIFVIQRLDRDKGETETFVSGPGGAIRPTPSPDGKHLAFVKRLPNMRSAIYVKDLVSGNERALYKELDRDLQETAGSHGNTPAFAWTPDAGSIVFWAAGKIRRINVTDGHNRDIPVHVKDQRQLRQALRFPVAVAPDTLPVKALRWAQYSLDRSKVVFQALGYLYVKDLRSGERKRLTRQADHFEYWPSLSVDGKSVVYTTWNDQELGSVRVVPLRGGQGQTITSHKGHYVEPRFSADGSQVVYRKISGGYLLSPLWSHEPGIYVVATRGGQPTRVSDSGFNAQFSADGQRVIYSDSVEETQLALNSVDLNGLDPRNHLKGEKITEFSVSPNGRWVAFTEHYNAYIAPFAITGKTVELSKGMKSLPVKQVSKRAGESLVWSPASDSLSWSNGATLYHRMLTDAFAFLDGAPEALPEPVTDGLDLSFDVPADKPSGSVALTGARIVTMRMAGQFEEVIQDGTVVVEANRIVAVGPTSEVEMPADAFVLDVSGKTVIPGLVDAHAHGGMGSSEIIPQQNWMQYSNLSFGVTTIHDPSNDTTEIFAHAEMQRAGRVIGPRTFSTGAILYGALVPELTTVIDSLEDAKFHLQRLKDVGAISVKSYNQLRRDSRQQVIAAGADLGMMVVPEGGMKFQHNLTHIIDGHTGLEHSLPIAHVYGDVIQLWSLSEVGYTPTFGVAYGGLTGETYWYDRSEVWRNERLMRYTPKGFVLPQAMRRTTAPDEHYNHFIVAANAKKLNDAGVSVHIGAHGQREGLAAHWEMWMMQQGGFTPWQAMRGATIDGARHLGLDRDIGSIEVGKLADLVVIDGNPLADIRQSERVSHTMINGRLYEAASMNEVGTGDRRRQVFFFEVEGGDAFPIATQKTLEAKATAYRWRH